MSNLLFIFKNLGLSIPFLIFTGPFLPDLIITVSSIFFIFYLIINRKTKFLINNFFLFFIIFWITTLISSFLSYDIMSLKSSLTYLRFGVFVMFLLYLSKEDKNFLFNFEKVFFYSFIILFFDAFFQYLFGYNLLGYIKDSRLSSFFGEEKIMGSYIVKMLPIYLSLCFINNNKIDIKISIIFFISLILIILSNERSALVSFTIFFLLFFIFSIKDWKKKLTYLGIFVTLIIIIIGNSERLQKRFITDTFSEFKIPLNKKKNYSSDYYIFSESHDAYFKTAFNMFIDKPFLGHGNKQFRVKCKNKNYSTSIISCNTHPHNYYIQALAEGGIMLFILLSFVFLYYCYLLIKLNCDYKKNTALLTSVIGNIVIFWPFITTGNFFNNVVSIFIFLNISLFIMIYEKKN